LNHIPISLNALQAWSDITAPRINLSLPFKYFTLTLGFAIFTLVFPALWAGSMTPVATTTFRTSSLSIPSYADVSLIKEYPSEVGSTGPFTRTRQGLFGYSVGIQMEGQLISSGSSATPPDNGPRLHQKLDNTGFTYVNRSYGVGSSIGLLDGAVTTNNLALSYSYIEAGYMAMTACAYNESSAFVLMNTTDLWVYQAYGELPDSDAGPEESAYVGHTMDSIVALGVAHFAASPGADPGSENELQQVVNLRRFIGFAAGSNYDFLDKLQCTIDFVPTRFIVTVHISGRNITVSPLPGDASDIEASRNLTNTLMRQFELISNDETNLYESAIGSAFNASVTDFHTAQAALNKTTDANSSVLVGVQNSLTAMADDMLVAYASAQLMVGNISQQNSIQVEVEAVQFGTAPFIITLLVLNLMLVAVVLEEIIRTAFWREMPTFNYTDLRHLIVAASTGGSGISDFVYGDGDNQKASANDDMMHQVLGATTIELGRYRGRPALVPGQRR